MVLQNKLTIFLLIQNCTIEFKKLLLPQLRNYKTFNFYFFLETKEEKVGVKNQYYWLNECQKKTCFENDLKSS